MKRNPITVDQFKHSAFVLVFVSTCQRQNVLLANACVIEDNLSCFASIEDKLFKNFLLAVCQIWERCHKLINEKKY